MRWKRRTAFLPVAAVCLVAGAVSAEDDPAACWDPGPGGPASTADPPTAPTCEAAANASSGQATQLEELVVEAQRPVSAASSREVRAKDFMIRPHLTIMQVLNNVPGLLVGQHQGGGKAPQWFVRGFDADHGTDVAVYADDMPINLVSHAHGQGYADPNFLIPEVIDRIELYKGPYFPQFGDFATAGTVS